MMDFVLQTPSLQHLAGVRIVAHLWSQHDVFNLGQCFEPVPVKDLTDDAPEWLSIKNRVESKVWALPLPQRCKKPLVDVVKSLGNEIIYWCQYYNEDNNSPRLTVKLLDILLPPQLCWSMRGTIDYAKTAELIVKDERVDLQKRFELACINSFEDEARVLFTRVAEECKQEYVNILRYVRRPDLSRLILFFTRSINLDVRKHESMLLSGVSSINKRLFEDVLCSGNRLMCEYLFQTLIPEEKDQVLDDCQMLLISSIQSPTCILFYLSQMNEEQQRRMFRECIIDLLIFLLGWPMQSLFMEAVKCGWQFMDSGDCMIVLFNITRKINDGSNDFDYCSLFWECWRLTPGDYAPRLLDNVTFIDNLLLIHKVEFIKLILNEAPSHQLKNAFNKISRVLTDESVVSDAALLEWKQTAALISLKDQENVEKRLKSEYVSALVDLVMENRMRERRKSPNENL